MKQLLTYHELEAMGVTFIPHHIRTLVRKGQFPKAVKGGGIDGVKRTGKNAKFYWSKADVEKYVASK